MSLRDLELELKQVGADGRENVLEARRKKERFASDVADRTSEKGSESCP